MARVPSVGTRTVGSQFKVTAADIKPQRTPLPQGGSTQGLDAGAKALTALGGNLQRASNQLAEAGAVEQHKDDLHRVRQHVTEYDRSNLDATYGKLGPTVGGIQGAPVPGYRDLKGDAFLREKDGILSSSEDRRMEIRGKLDESLHGAFDRLTEESSQSFRLKLENYNLAQKEFARDSANKRETGFVIDRIVKESIATIDDGGTLAEMIEMALPSMSKLVSLALESAEAQAAPPGEEGDVIRQEIVKGILDVAHASVIDRLTTRRLTKEAKAYLKVFDAQMTSGSKTEALRVIRVAENAAVTAITDTVRELTTVSNGGGTPNPELWAATEIALTGSDSPQATSLRREMKESKVDNKFLSVHRTKSIAYQAQWLADAEARKADPSIVQTAGEIRRIDKARIIFAYINKEIKAGNGLAVASRYGMIGYVAPLRLADPASYRIRSQQAADASAAFGVYISPLSAAEIKSVNDLVATGLQADGSTMSPQKTAEVVLAMSLGLGRLGAHAIAASAVNDSEVAAYVIANAPDRPIEFIRDIIQGQRNLDAVPNLKPSTEDLKDAREVVFGNVFAMGTLENMAGYEAAAIALYASRRSAKGKVDFDGVAYGGALLEVTGGILEWGDQKLFAPFPGMTQEQLDKAMAALTQRDLTTGSSNGSPPVHQDGTPFNVEDFDKPRFSTGTDSELVSVGPGIYQIFTPGSGYARTDDATYYEIDLRTLIDAGLIDKAPRQFLSPEALKFSPSTSGFSSVPEVTRSLSGKKNDPVITDEFIEAAPVDLEEQHSRLVGDEVNVEQAAQVWGRAYQGESDPDKEADFVADVRDFFKTASDSAVVKIGLIKDTIAQVFEGDEGSDLGRLQELATMVAIHESGLTETKQRGGGPGRGIFQVELNTAKSLLENSTLIGPNAVVALAEQGWDIAKEYSKAQMNKFLENDVISTVFGVAQLLSGAKAKGGLALLSTDPEESEGSLLQQLASAVSPTSVAHAGTIIDVDEVPVETVISQLVPAHVRAFVTDVVFHQLNLEQADRDETYFSLDERKAIKILVGNAQKRLGTNKGDIDYDLDYSEGQRHVSFSSSRLFGDAEFNVQHTLGDFLWEIADDGTITITDQYNFDDAEKVRKRYPSALDKLVSAQKAAVNAINPTHPLGPYGFFRHLGALYGSPAGSGARFKFKLGKLSN